MRRRDSHPGNGSIEEPLGASLESRSNMSRYLPSTTGQS